jgi:XTP/dITP diphosphohydrolase
MEKLRVVFASNNRKKIDEIQRHLPKSIQLISLTEIGCTEELAEDGQTLFENSFQKANYIYKKYQVNCFADDTGLIVDALDGAPGVYSARYAGTERNDEANIQLLLDNLSASTNRKAKFQTVITLLINEEKHVFIGEVEGEIVTIKKGDSGFGYDPVFRPIGFEKTFAEMTIEEKNAISHRGRAVDALVKFLTSIEFNSEV